MKPSMREFCEAVVKELNECPAEKWAEIFVNSKIKFQREYADGLIFSTVHGIDFFKHVLNGKWPEYDPVTRIGESGEYGNNFRKLLKKL